MTKLLHVFLVGKFSLEFEEDLFLFDSFINHFTENNEISGIKYTLHTNNKANKNI